MPILEPVAGCTSRWPGLCVTITFSGTILTSFSKENDRREKAISSVTSGHETNWYRYKSYFLRFTSFISYWKLEPINQWLTRRSIPFQALLASSFIPIFGGYNPPIFRNHVSVLGILAQDMLTEHLVFLVVFWWRNHQQHTNLTIFGWSNSFRSAISLIAVLGTPSDSLDIDILTHYTRNVW